MRNRRLGASRHRSWVSRSALGMGGVHSTLVPARFVSGLYRDAPSMGVCAVRLCFAFLSFFRPSVRSLRRLLFSFPFIGGTMSSLARPFALMSSLYARSTCTQPPPRCVQSRHRGITFDAWNGCCTLYSCARARTPSRPDPLLVVVCQPWAAMASCSSVFPPPPFLIPVMFQYYEMSAGDRGSLTIVRDRRGCVDILLLLRTLSS
ncbi:hypothetical protein DFP72DRAFT_881899, partial [Ephemerocybe angulata]